MSEEAETKGLDIDAKKLMEGIGQEFLRNIADRLLQNIDDNINNEKYPTVTEKGYVTGIVDTGEYKGSWLREVVEAENLIIVGSIDQKAKKIEFGSTPEQNSGLKDSEIIRWAQRNKIPSPIQFGKKLAQYIRENGTPPKPALRQAIDQTKAEQNKILSKTKRDIKDRIERLT